MDGDDRQELVRVLSAEGMSTRAIAPIVGASHMTVANDIVELGVKNFTPDECIEFIDPSDAGFPTNYRPNLSQGNLVSSGDL